MQDLSAVRHFPSSEVTATAGPAPALCPAAGQALGQADLGATGDQAGAGDERLPTLSRPAGGPSADPADSTGPVAQPVKKKREKQKAAESGAASYSLQYVELY